jgi:predicted extracellular nuclease
LLANWTFSGPNALDGETSNDTAAVPFPIGSYLPPGADFPPTVASTFPVNGTSSFPTNANITIVFSEPVTVTDPWFTIDCSTSGVVPASETGGPEEFVLDLDSDLVDGETCTVTVDADQVVDQDDPPDNMVEDYVFSFSTPPFVFIHDIQGTPDNQGIYFGRPDASPLRGDVVKVEAIVVADFQGLSGPEQLDAFFIQEEDDDADDDTRSSEGILVYCGSTCPTDVMVGQQVQVTGLVEEYFGMTQLRATFDSDVIINSDGNPLPTPAAPDLPVIGDIDIYYEQFEGMLVRFVDELVVSEYFQLARFGQFVLTEDARARQFTDANEPSEAGYSAFLDDLSTKRIILDDDNNIQNDAIEDGPDAPYFWPRQGLSIDNFVRGGDSITNLTGVLHWSWAGSSGTDAWRVRPVEEAFDYDFEPNLQRPEQPEAVGGTLKVASFNVLNYFTTLDEGPEICGPLEDQGCRGANSLREFEFQRSKIIAAMLEIDADVLGLMEIENNPANPVDEPLEDLVAGLNDAAGAGTYAYIDTGSIGSDAIKVALIYKTATVNPVGSYAILDSSVDFRFNDDKNRPTLAQTFEEFATGGKLTVVVNHLKSKGSPCDDVGDPDLNDGQANCPVTRTNAALAMADWLATDPTGSGDADILIIGDLNAYRKEDPIAALVLGADDTPDTSDDYTDLLDFLIGPSAYSYLFDGQLGYLDHALSNVNLLDQVQGVTVWNINADEIPVFDYNDDIRDPGEASFERESWVLPLIEEEEPYRASDHDPVIVGLTLNGSPVCTEAAPSIDTLWPVNHKFVPIDILGVTDPEDDPITVTIDSIFQDEKVLGRGSGKTSPDGQGIGSSTAEVRAERSGNGNGRVYHITFTANDDQGNSCTSIVKVSVPKDQGNNGEAIDDGALYDSTESP